MGEDDFVCPNCNSNQQVVGQPHARKVQNPGRQYNPFSSDPGSNPMQFQKGAPLNTASVKDKDEKEDVDPELVPYESEDFLMQCIDPNEVNKKRRNVDEDIEQVTKSCLDLEIDG